MSTDWRSFLKTAYLKARESHNPSTQNGAVLINDAGKVLISAVNGFPNGVAETKERQIKPLRHKFSVHAERNALYQAAKLGIKTNGLIMVCPWATCSDCAQAIIQTGVIRLVVHKQALEKSGSWKKNIALAFEMLREAGVELMIYDGKIRAGKILRSGSEWKP